MDYDMQTPHTPVAPALSGATVAKTLEIQPHHRPLPRPNSPGATPPRPKSHHLRPLYRPAYRTVTGELRRYSESPTASLILNDAVKAGHQIDAASRNESLRRLAAEINRCLGQLRVCSMPLPTLETRQPGTRQTRRAITTGSMKLQLPLEDACRLLLGHADKGIALPELLLDQNSLPI
eukprot:jgi/Tetstr1/438400/TSEL_026966.t1